MTSTEAADGQHPLDPQPPPTTVAVRLLKPGKGAVVVFHGDLLHHHGGHLLIEARWERPRLDLGYVVFETGDRFLEHYFTDRWYNIYELRSTQRVLKGWYCNITRPASFDGSVIVSEDLEIDLFVPPGRGQPLVLDMDEFEARGFAQHDPQAASMALAALSELQRMVREGEPPFDAT